MLARSSESISVAEVSRHNCPDICEWQVVCSRQPQDTITRAAQELKVGCKDRCALSDLRVSSAVEEINENGGIMLVVAAVPDSQREWIQWKGGSFMSAFIEPAYFTTFAGRTARQDNKGQYQVILDHRSPLFRQVANPSNIEELLQHVDKSVADDLKDATTTLEAYECKHRVDALRSNALREHLRTCLFLVTALRENLQRVQSMHAGSRARCRVGLL